MTSALKPSAMPAHASSQSEVEIAGVAWPMHKLAAVIVALLLCAATLAVGAAGPVAVLLGAAAGTITAFALRPRATSRTHQ